MPSIREIFDTSIVSEADLERVRAIEEPSIKYVIAITPRSGSSHLSDVMKRSKVFGSPGEVLAAEFIPNIIKRVPAKNADEYLKNVFKVLCTPNGVSGLKTSWFQFQTFCRELNSRTEIKKYRYIYLTRRDLYAQAVSLYKATESKVFHTNIEHTEDALEKLETLQYDYEKINKWYEHIVAQEAGWLRFFDKNNISPLYITYEDIDKDVVAVAHRIGRFLGVKEYQDKCSCESIFEKVSDRRNLEWARQFALEKYEMSL